MKQQVLEEIYNCYKTEECISLKNDLIVMPIDPVVLEQHLTRKFGYKEVSEAIEWLSLKNLIGYFEAYNKDGITYTGVNFWK